MFLPSGSPFLNKGVVFIIFQTNGTFLELCEFLEIITKPSTVSLASSFQG